MLLLQLCSRTQRAEVGSVDMSLVWSASTVRAFEVVVAKQR